MLYPYQEKALEEIRSHFQKNENKVLLHAATGSGKTHIFSQILKSIHQNKKRALLIVRGRKLVDQASVRLFREEVPHGVYMANHWRFRPDMNIQICSIDSLNSRRPHFPDAHLIIIDEAHQAISKSYQAFIGKHPGTFILGVTATPYTKKSLRHIADHIVHPISLQELIEQGYLVPPRYFAPVIPDLSSVKMDYKTGDYNQKQLSGVMSEAKIQGDILKHWRNLGRNRPTLCFATSISHSKLIEKEFNDAGIPAKHCDADSSDREREKAIDDLNSGKLKLITNVGIFCTGVDIPAVSCLILGRPTQSYILYVQQMGRGTRLFDGKEDFIVLDHGGNVLRHGFIENEREGALDGNPFVPKIKAMQCKSCFAVVPSWPCSYCGASGSIHSKGPRKFDVDLEAELSEMQIPPEVPVYEHSDVIADIQVFDRIKKENGFKEGFVWHKIRAKYGEDVARVYLGGRFKRQAHRSR